jgi:hypothetical protein
MSTIRPILKQAPPTSFEFPGKYTISVGISTRQEFMYQHKCATASANIFPAQSMSLNAKQYIQDLACLSIVYS